MAELKPQKYRDPRPAGELTRFYEWAQTHEADWVYDLIRIVVTLLTLPSFRFMALGTENIPVSGPVILAPNHFSNWDHFFCGIYSRRRNRFMAKSQLFGNPVLRFIISHGGAFPIRRGHADDESFRTAHSILERGGCVLIYAEGGRSRSGELGKPRPGVGRLALESGAPVVPVAIHGSAGVRHWSRLRFPKVTIQYGEPLSFDAIEQPSREQQREASERIFDGVREIYAALDEKGRRGVIRARREARVAGEERPASGS